MGCLETQDHPNPGLVAYIRVASSALCRREKLGDTGEGSWRETDRVPAAIGKGNDPQKKHPGSFAKKKNGFSPFLIP